mmetsp:Transcript_42020/g.75453  ORF Transcript_42020/g.75453 Transcript_42020/m.75453 type:complete len:653 (-) Transcript_42020:641-2599(-)
MTGSVTTHRISRVDLRQATQLYLCDVVTRMWNKHVKQQAMRGIEFASSVELPMFSGTDTATTLEFVNEMIGRLQGSRYLEWHYSTLRSAAEKLDNAQESPEMLDLFLQLAEVQHGTVGKVNKRDVGLAQVAVFPSTGKCVLTCEGPEFQGQPVPSVALNSLLRLATRAPTPAEYLVIYFGYVQVVNGVIPSYPDYRFHGTSGFRKDAQTYMSLTDPGDGHCMDGTWNADWMKGAIVHVEWLERPKSSEDRSMIESYRVSSFVDFMKVRTHVGNAAPTTWFVGRPLKDSGIFNVDFLKVVHTTAASLSSAFIHGAAECKLVMEGLTSNQMLEYMHHMAAQVSRNKAKQYLSAAFPLNTPLTDDRPEVLAANGGNPKIITDKFEIGKTGVVLAAMGGFDKVTFDGAGDVYPSVNILEQLGRAESVELVHLAHERGLLTYYSAGFKIKDDSIAKAVLTGTDGVGIGGAQVLRHMDHTTGMHGPYQPENLPVILGLRNAAQETTLGLGVRLLCRLDRMFFEGTIDEPHQPRREALLRLLQTDDEEGVTKMLAECKDVMDMPHDGETPMVGYFKRLLVAKNPLIKQHIVMEVGEKGWRILCGKVKVLLDAEDEEELCDIYSMDPFLSWRHGCHEEGALRMRSKLKLGKQTRHLLEKV